jgi:hypothetical protein
MDKRLVGALAIARRADLWIRVLSDDRSAVRLDGPVMEVGPSADPNAVVTFGCRRILARCGVHDEASVLRLVEHYGFAYVPQPWTMAGALLAS